MVEDHLLIRAIDILCLIVWAAMLDPVGGNVNHDHRIGPVYLPDPFGRQQQLRGLYPVTCLYYEKMESPGCIVDDKIRNLADLTIYGMDTIAGHAPGTA